MSDFFSGSFPDNGFIRSLFLLRGINFIISFLFCSAMMLGNYSYWKSISVAKNSYSFGMWHRRILRLRLRWALSTMVLTAVMRTGYSLYTLWHFDDASLSAIPVWVIMIDIVTLVSLVATALTIYMYAQVTDAG